MQDTLGIVAVVWSAGTITMTDSKIAMIDGQKVTITFPFNRDIIRDIKDIEGRRWDPNNHQWVVPLSSWHCLQLVNALEPHGFWLDPGILEAAYDKEAVPPPDADYPAGLYEFQKAGVEFIRKAKGRVILADAMGLGKTITSLAYVRMFCGRALVVAPASVVYKWGAEIEKWLPGWKCQLITKGKENIEADADVLVMSYAIMVRKYRDLELEPFDVVLLDEAHAIKSYKSQRHRVAKALIRRSSKILFLSGTPFLNHPQEIFPLLNIADPTGYANFFTFAKRYLGAQYINGAWYFPNVVTNREELAERISGIMIRRILSDVDMELPDLQRVSMPVEIDNLPAYRTAVRDVRSWLRDKGREVLNPQHVLTRLNVLRQVAGEGKVAHAIELAENVLNDGRKVVLFAHHRDVVAKLAGALREYGVKLIVGDISQEERGKNANLFLSPDSSCRVMIISTAGAEGIDLYSASDIIFVEREWTPAREEQAEARLHRNGQKNAVTAHYLVAKGTVDEKLDAIVRQKRDVFGQVIRQEEVLETILKELEA